MVKSPKNPIKKNIKPELSYKVIPKKQAKNVAKKKPKPKKNHKTIKLLIKYKHITVLLFVIAVLLGVAYWYINETIKSTTALYDNSVLVARSFLTVNSRDVQVASVVGSNEQLAKEIENYQSAPDDLKTFLLKDYRAFKGNCVVNGKLIGPVEYKVENVVYDQYARLKRTCISNDSAIVAKIGGRWSVVTAGNSLPECRVVNDLNLPQGVTLNCTDGMVIYTNPNP